MIITLLCYLSFISSQYPNNFSSTIESHTNTDTFYLAQSPYFVTVKQGRETEDFIYQLFRKDNNHIDSISSAVYIEYNHFQEVVYKDYNFDGIKDIAIVLTNINGAETYTFFNIYIATADSTQFIFQELMMNVTPVKGEKRLYSYYNNFNTERFSIFKWEKDHFQLVEVHDIVYNEASGDFTYTRNYYRNHTIRRTKTLVLRDSIPTTQGFWNKIKA